MRRLLVSLIICSSVLLAIGCRSFVESRSGVEVIIDGDGRFPASLVGTWKSDNGAWEIVFEPDGSISSAVVSLGRVRMIPGRVTIVPMKLGGRGVFEPGQWTVQYMQEQRELIVEIVIDRFRVEMEDNVVRGRSRDFFVGAVSEDGTSWWADRFSYPEYIADTKKHPDIALGSDPNDNPRESLLFQKVPQAQ